jgi:archaeal flagellin FlaB
MVQLKKDNEAFTGLEASMVLIAFVVVASVFSYVMLGAGFFSTQKSQQVIQAGIGQTSGNIALKGEIFGIADNNTATIEKIQFGVGPAIAGTNVDFSRMGITWSTNNVTPVRLDFTRDAPMAGQWSFINGSPGPIPDTLVSDSHIITIMVCPPAPVFPNDRLTLELIPESGAATGISRTVPAVITRSNILY